MQGFRCEMGGELAQQAGRGSGNSLGQLFLFVELGRALDSQAASPICTEIPVWTEIPISARLLLHAHRQIVKTRVICATIYLSSRIAAAARRARFLFVSVLRSSAQPVGCLGGCSEGYPGFALGKRGGGPCRAWRVLRFLRLGR